MAARAGAVESSLVVRADRSWAARRVATVVDGLAARVRVPAKAGLAVANGAMVFGRAQRLLAARFLVLAGRSADVFIAELVEGAVVVRLALDATAVGLRVAGEPRLARADGAVTPGHTLRIAAAKNSSLARIPALGAAVRVDYAVLVRQAVVVGATADLLRADVVLAVLEVGAA